MTMLRTAIVAALVFASQPIAAQALPDDTPVRIVASGLGNGVWLEGKLKMNKPSGCTMVYLDRKQADGYSLVALNAVTKLERRDKVGWVDVPVKPLLAKEKKSCREAAND